MPQFVEMQIPRPMRDSRPDRRAATASVVVGYDGSETARRAVVRAGELAGAGGRVVVVSVARSGAPNALTEPTVEAPPPEETARLLAEGAALLGDGGFGVDLRGEEGDPADAITAAARETGADLIVVGARSGDFVARTLLGSVAAKLVERAPCDVLVVR